MSGKAVFTKARAEFHAALLRSVLTSDDGIPSNADKKNRISVAIAVGLCRRIGEELKAVRPAGQTSGRQFEEICGAFLQQTFLELGHLRPGRWRVQRGGSLSIAAYDQYQHLAQLEAIASVQTEVAIALGSDYLIKPDIVISRTPEPDEEINKHKILVSDGEARKSVLRERNNTNPILHASVSCKWTLRSDRAQNARSEGLNLVKNRKGRLPHIVVITAEPSPGRIASIALGTGEIDCVYHFALHELQETVKELNIDDETLNVMIEGNRLRDISDLPLDLAV